MEETKIANKPSLEKDGAHRASTKGLDIIITGSIMLVFLLSPIFFTGLVAQGIGFEKITLFYFLVLLGTVAWVTKGVIQGELNLKRTPLDLPILAILVIFAISTALSVSAKDSLIGAYGSSAKGLVTVFVLALFYYLLVNNLDAKRIKLFFWTILASTGLLTIFSLLQINGIHILPFGFTKTASFNPLGSLSGLTTYLVIVLPLLVVGVAQTKEILPKLAAPFIVALKIFFGIVSVAALATLMLLNGFTFWPIAIVGIVIVLMFFLAKVIKITTNNLLIPLAMFLGLIILLVLGNFDLVNLNLPAEVSLSRSASWEIAKASVVENPVFGSGPSTFYYDFSKFKNLSFNTSPLWNIRFDSATGSVFELLATVGILGTLAVTILGLIALSVTFLTLIKTNSREINSILLGLFASLISAVLFALLFSQNNSLLLIISLISIFAVSSGLVMYPEKFSTLKLSFRASPKYALALAAIFLCVSAGVVVLFTMGLKMYLADMYAKDALLAGEPRAKIELLSKATSLVAYQDTYFLSLANNYMALANQAAMGGQDQSSVGNNLSLAIESGRKAVEIADNKVANNESLALIYENASFYTRGALEWAEELYNKVIELDPNNPTAYLRIALVNMARANAETDNDEKQFYINEAIKYYDQSIEKKGDLAAAYYGKAIASEKVNNIEDAIEQLKKANLVSRNNLDYRFELGRLYFNRGVSQPKIDQAASQQIAENDIDAEGGTSTETQISVNKAQDTGAVTGRNTDLNTAEQLFLSILMANQSHANARYSLAVMYQKVGEADNLKIMVNSLLDIVQDEQTKNSIREQFKGQF